MKTNLILFVLFLMTLSLGCKPTRIYVVRHAEKSIDGTKDPVLTPEGEERAKTLANLLRKKEIEKIYSTSTKRTESTAKQLSLLINKPILHYSSDSIPQFVIRVLDSAVNTLIVGHSNTVLKILIDMGLNPSIKEIGENDYDNLFIVSLRNQNGAVGYKMGLNESRYGKSSNQRSKN